jgi:hypothetical protein
MKSEVKLKSEKDSPKPKELKETEIKVELKLN